MLRVHKILFNHWNTFCRIINDHVDFVTSISEYPLIPPPLFISEAFTPAAIFRTIYLIVKVKQANCSGLMSHADQKTEKQIFLHKAQLGGWLQSTNPSCIGSLFVYNPPPLICELEVSQGRTGSFLIWCCFCLTNVRGFHVLLCQTPQRKKKRWGGCIHIYTASD